ncbi:MAG: sensor histidine kinase KdpD [Polyangiaceae bacterium]|nr:sensor histidine kinase KdpD [Polyangiaceae bacterium]MCE7888365.1 sensor histidine kinase KdpD [Sorangiineae bacterium PRO1]MCL4749504.1 sensor histidine kinase KdpD [Myxococcales bacterium]
MNDGRPDPERLLLRAEAEEAEERKKLRGRLTIFFGAAPGVGKTYAMLQEASFERDVEDRDVVVGVVETHGRFETTTLLAGFERLPRREVEYRGTTLDEFDLDAALARKPSLLLVDELAHTNAEGSRHPKRWQDVEELLEAGIDVMTTLNVQHVESLNDLVARVTGVVVRETVPDSVIDSADEIKLIDLPPEELLERLREGKVYVPAQAERAMENFFRKGNLIALRELALRTTAERVDADMQAWRRAQGIEKTWGISERILVCISPSPHSAPLLRAGRRIAARLHADWFAVNVETPATQSLPATERARLSAHLRLAESLGAATVTLSGQRAAEELLKFAREHGVTKIVVGKQRVLRWRDRLRTSFVDELILGSGDIDVYVTAGEQEDAEPKERPAARLAPAPGSGALREYAMGAAVVAATTLVAYAVFGRDPLADVVMTYLLGIVLVSMRFRFRVALASAVLSVLAFDVFFIPPYLTFSVADLRHVVTFAVMLLVAVVIAGLTQRVKDQAQFAKTSERRTAVLYALSRDLGESIDEGNQARIACRHLEDVFDATVAVFTRSATGDTELLQASAGLSAPLDKEVGVVRWVANQAKDAGIGTDNVPGAQGLYVPLAAASGEVLGVLGLYPKNPERLSDPEQRRLVQSLALQIASAMERARLAGEAQRARVRMETEQLRSSLLSSVSHDLRTPLAVMKGAASSIVDDDAALPPETRRDLAQTLLEETERLERLVANLLDMTRLESGAVRVEKEWQSVEEIVGGALARTERQLARHPVEVSVPPDLLLPCDGVLVEQALVNLLENAAKHTPEGTAVEISAARAEHDVTLCVADRGPGLAPGEERQVFEKFHRGPSEQATPGFGLGLAICRAIALAHGGRIHARNRSEGGAAFELTLPVEGEPPSAPPPEIPDKSGSVEAG